MNQNPRRPRVGTVFIFAAADGLTRYSSGGREGCGEGRTKARSAAKKGAGQLAPLLEMMRFEEIALVGLDVVFGVVLVS